LLGSHQSPVHEAKVAERPNDRTLTPQKEASTWSIFLCLFQTVDSLLS
jgi:hypothetical protein